MPAQPSGGPYPQPMDPAPPAPHGAGTVVHGSRQGRWLLTATIAASGMAFLDSTVVNVALPAIRADLGAGLAGLQWTVNAYTLTLASFVLLGGSLGDRLGRRRVFLVGVCWFAGASLLCGLAPGTGALVAARGLQGLGAALLTPGSLALLQSGFRPQDRARAIGTWSGLAGITTAIGPAVGGYLVQVASWRWVFLLNVPVAAFVVVVTLRHVPQSPAPGARGRLDPAGAVLAALALGGVTYALTEAGGGGGLTRLGVLAGVAGVLAGLGFVAVESRVAEPMLPLRIFADRLFAGANLVTFAVYAALAGTLFLLVQYLQVGPGFSPLQAGSAFVPLTVVMFALSSRAGALAARVGYRPLLTAGPLVSALGLLLLARVPLDASYLTDVLPGVLLLGLGMSTTVAPVTAAAMAGASDSGAGVAAGVNNAVARAAGLLAVAALPLAAGLGPGAYDDPPAFAAGLGIALHLCAGLLVVGAAVAVTVLARPTVER